MIVVGTPLFSEGPGQSVTENTAGKPFLNCLPKGSAMSNNALVSGRDSLSAQHALRSRKRNLLPELTI